MGKKQFLLRWGLAGFIIPLILSAGLYAVGWRMANTNVHVFGFFWISYVMLMGLGTIQTIFGFIFAYLFIVSVNVGYYFFLGWLIWQGKTKNKLYYLALPLVVSVVWGGIYLRSW